eukprot:SAG22_NODE_147_length_17533_cov_46.384536_7_plen_89_part_00
MCLQFALKTGECLSDPGAYHILTFRAKSVGGKVLVELPPARGLDEILETAARQVKGSAVTPPSTPPAPEPAPAAAAARCGCADPKTEW